MIKYIKNNYKELLIIFVSILFNSMIIKSHYNDTFFNKQNYVLLFIVFLLNIIITIFYCLIIKKNLARIKVEKIYLYIAIPLSIIYLFIIPINSPPDELAHILRSYDISYGNLISKKNQTEVGNELTSGLYEYEDYISDYDGNKYLNYYKGITVNYSKEKRWYSFNTSALYSFVSYIPQSIGIFIGRMLNIPIYFQIMLARILNLIFWITSIYLLIKNTINFKYMIMLITLTPIAFQTSISCSADVPTIIVSMSLIIFVEHLIYRNKKINNKDYLIMILLAVLLALLKIVYVPLVLLYFIIPKDRFENNKKRFIYIISSIILALVSNVIWTKLSIGFINETATGINPSKQIAYVLSNPIRFILIMFKTISVRFDNYMMTAVGSHLEWLNVPVNKVYVYLYLFMMIFISLLTTYKKNNTNKTKNVLIISFITCMVVGMIFSSLYVQWNPVGSSDIDGIQGRYFIPIFLLLSYLLSKIKIENKEKIKLNYNYCLLLTVLFNLAAIISIFFHHI